MLKQSADIKCSCLQFLQVIAEAVRPLGRRAAFYLAAAVSDFFVPWADMVCALSVFC